MTRGELALAIVHEARAQGVRPAVAVAFADLESNLVPTAQGDLRWHENTARFERLVLHAPKFRHNPWRHKAELWHAYGLFQLLAPYHTRPLEDPRALLDLEVNIRRGVRTVRACIAASRGSVTRARLRYTGALQAGTGHQLHVLSRLQNALEKWAFLEIEPCPSDSTR